MHLDSAIAFVEALDLNNVTIVMQDRGGIIGMPLVAEMPDRFARLVLMNTAMWVSCFTKRMDYENSN